MIGRLAQNKAASQPAATDWIKISELWMIPIGIVIGASLIGYVVQTVLIKKLEKLFAKTETDLDDLVLAAIRRHLPIWFFLAGLAVASRFAPVDQKHVHLAERGAIVGFWISLTFASANLGSAFLSRFANKDDSGVTGASLTRNILRGVIISFGALLILQNVGVEITPLITALGVGSFAIALGLQPTLADLFAGIHITLTRHVRVQDVVLLENGVKGRVLDVGWRAVRILDGNDNVVVVPNGKLAGMVVTNTHFPDTTLITTVECSVGYNCDLAKVEKVALEVARDVLQSVAGGVAKHTPLVRFHTFGDNAVLFRVILRAEKFGDQGILVHEFMKRLKARFEAENIDIPFPQRVVRIINEKGAA